MFELNKIKIEVASQILVCRDSL